jgi:LysM repeat protein
VGLALAVASVATSAGAAHAEQSYTVRPGDTVSHIALRTGASVDAIVRANKLNQRAFIQIGQQLAIPTGAPAAAAPAAAAPAAAVALAAHTVRSGDTLSAIAVKYATTVSAIAKANKLANPGLLRIGQQLSIPGTTAQSAPAAVTPAARATVTYAVRSGDTAAGIAAKFGTTIGAIAKANKLANPSYLRIGQQLTVPGVAAVQLVGNTFAGRTYPQATVDSANKNKAALLRVGAPSKADMKDLVGATARAMGVDPKLALAVAYQESGFDHSAVSPANAIGVMQVIPTSGQWASDLVGRQLNLLDPRDNVIAGVAILRRLLQVSPDLPTVVAAYYQGLTSVRTNGMFADTRVYVANVQTLMARFA